MFSLPLSETKLLTLGFVSDIKQCEEKVRQIECNSCDIIFQMFGNKSACK